MYRLYQIFILCPVLVVMSVWAGTTMAVMCPFVGWLKKVLPFSLGILTRPDWWGTLASHWWAKVIVHVALIPVTVHGRENIRPGTSYVFVANHQGAFDIFLVCGFLGVEIRWMMKRALEKVPFLGIGCRHAGYVFVDKGNPGKVRSTYRHAENVLQGGASLMVFPEGSRSRTGAMSRFKKGAFALADELQLPIVPMTINGSFDILPPGEDGGFVHRHPLTLTIHKPIYPQSQGDEDILKRLNESYEVIRSALDAKYKG